MKTHELKIWPQYFEAVEDGTKTFEVRKNDRDFWFGDKVILKEWSPDKEVGIQNDRIIYSEPKGYTGRELTFRIGYILPLEDSVVVFSLLRIDDETK